MLQIASGRFFGGADVYEHEGKGILFSNMSWVGPIGTCAGTLEPVDTIGSEVSSYVLSYVNRMEKTSDGVHVVRVGDEEIVEQFGWLCAIWFRAFFDGDRQTVLVNCREKRAHAGDQHVGARFAKPFLGPERRITAEEADGFARFVDKAIGLRRRDYRALMDFLRAVSHALHVLRQDIDLAYSMLVYALEALGKGRGDHAPRWEDYDEATRKRLAPILAGLPPETSDALRGALLEGAHVKLQRRFVEFTLSHVPDRFFAEDAVGVDRPVRLSELERGLKDAYRARSRYVHELVPLMHQVKSPGIGEAEVFVWDNRPHLTFSGLLRVARAVVLDFVEGQPYLEEEEYDWKPELPGMVTLMPAAQYWIWAHDAFVPRRSGEWLSGFLQLWLETVSRDPSEEHEMPNLAPLLAKFEGSLASASPEQRRRMLVIHALYNRNMAPKTPDHEAVFRSHERLFDDCSIEAMVLLLLTGRDLPWEAARCAEAYDAYVRNRSGRSALSLPWPVEVSLMTYVAGLHDDAGDTEGFRAWSRRALLESAGEAGWQEHILEARAAHEDGQDVLIDLNVFLAPQDRSLERSEANRGETGERTE